jgi:hypothetical protein
MKKLIIRNTLLLGISLLIFACTKDENEPYGPNYEITGIKLEISNKERYNDTIPANVFKVKIILMSDNDYAQQYGLNPRLKSKITNLQVSLDNYDELPLVTGSNAAPYFVIEDGNSYDSLYETIEQYVGKEQIVSLAPRLVFTNQTILGPKADKLVTDTVSIELSVKLTLDNNVSYSTQVKTVLKP